MALQSTDLLVVQQNQTVYKMTAGSLSQFTRDEIDVADLPIATELTAGVVKIGDNLNVTGDGTLSAVIPTGMNVKGMYDPTQDPPNAVAGDLYTMSSAGTLNSNWTGAANQVVSQNDAVIFTDAGAWDYLGAIFGGGVVSLSGSAPITVSGGAETPIVGIVASDENKAGSMSSAHYTKLEGIASGAQVGTVISVSVVSDKGLSVTKNTSEALIDLNEANKTTRGSVIFADAVAISNGASLRAVGADDLLSVSNRVLTLEGITQVSVTAGVYTTVSETAGVYTVDVKTAKETEAGVIQLASGAEVIAGTDTDKAVSSAAIAANYIPKDFSKLDALPA
jgi:hypothetical protein